MGFWKDLFSGGSKKEPATQAQVNQASEQISGMVENRDLLQDKAPVQVNSKFSDFLERNRREDGSYNSAAQAIINQYDDGRSNYQVAMEDIKNSPGGKQAFKKAFPNPLVKVAEGVGNYIKGGGILGILPNLMSNVNEKVGGIFNQDKAPTDMGTRMSSMDQADLDALKGPGMADISGPGTAATGFDNEADAIAAYNAENPNFPALNMGITNPELMNASSLLNFEDLLNYNVNDVKDIINSFKDNQGFDVQDNQLQYNLDAGPGKFQFGIGPNSAGINFNLPFGA
tara:strand:- start:4320 stop:5174 length:855 start_codon:yes stop_codon:yes gene_type:complete